LNDIDNLSQFDSGHVRIEEARGEGRWVKGEGKGYIRPGCNEVYLGDSS
jgi:hypothetical protein